MSDEYFVGAVNQLIERARCLKSKIPRNLPRDYDTLDRTCTDILANILLRIRHLRDDVNFKRPELSSERLRTFRRIVADLEIVEIFGIAALERAIDSDHLLNRLLEQITKEIAYPLPTPVVTTLSQRYFFIRSDLNLLCVPLAEGEFLLHLPDLYHELAHPLLVAADDPIIEPFQKAHERALGKVFDMIAMEIDKESGRRGPAEMGYLFGIWQIAWVKSWMTELFCDLFGVYTLGPAYAWSHLHLFAKRGGDPYLVSKHPTSHPADAARMTVILHGLAIIGFSPEADQIRDRWLNLVAQAGASAEPEHRRCYPDKMLAEIAQEGFEGVKGIRARMAARNTNDLVHSILNEAWCRFWKDPAQYTAWESTTVATLRSKFTQSP
jgi:hypothetical protein